MRLMTERLLEKFRRQGPNYKKESNKIKVFARFFNPYGPESWYVYDISLDYHLDESIRAKDIDQVWAFVVLDSPELAECGIVSIKELEEIKIKPIEGSKLLINIERDKHWKTKTLEQVIKKVKN